MLPFFLSCNVCFLSFSLSLTIYQSIYLSLNRSVSLSMCLPISHYQCPDAWTTLSFITTKSPIRISFLCFFSLSAELQVIFKFRVNTKLGMNYSVGDGNFSNRTCKTAEPNSMKTETSQTELSLQRLDRTVTKPEPSQPLGPNWDETRTFSDWT